MEPESLREADTIEKEESLPGMNTFIDQDPLVGTTLSGRYLIKKMIGHGGFGSVYRATDEKMMSRPVVVKILIDEKVSHEWSLKKFKQEMEAMARIDHPSIVGVLDSGETENGKPYIVMQYVDGVSLRALITVEGMDFARAANLVRQIGKALNAAHDRGILHRDLKPENIMVQTLDDGDEQVKIIDFGIAKVKDSVVSVSTGGDGTVGTAAYMSPEQLTAGPLGPASDVYSFATIAYEMLTGRRPMNPDSAYQLLEMQRAGVRIKPRELRPNLPEPAETVILKGLSFEPRDRYERAREFGDLLASALLDDDEITKLQTQTPAAMGREEGVTLETAHVLFMDIVGYSKLLIDQQKESLRKLQEIVLATEECKRATKDNLIRLPTGDGMALVFFGDPEAPVRCAVEISRALRENTDIELRMGVHSGLVYHIADINMNLNVAGGGINVAQRVMDCGDTGHILVSKRVADDLGQLARWSGYLHDLGNVQVKHGLQVHVFNLSGEDFGNATAPAKFASTVTSPVYKRAPVIAVSVLVILALAIAAWYAFRPKLSTVQNQASSTATVAPGGPEQSLTYWLTVQKMLDKKPLGKPLESVGNIIFGNGWKFRFNVRPTQPGALYLLNVGVGKNGAPEYNILFPLPRDSRIDANVAANQLTQSDWLQFVDQTGVEKLWIIWSAESVPELDSIFMKAAANQQSPGVVAEPAQIAVIDQYLKNFAQTPPERTDDLSQNLTALKGRGKVIVSLVELRHAEV